jgi:hypothetical protein
VSQAPQSNSHGPDGRFVKGHPGGPGRPRKVVTAAADALDERGAAKAGDLFDIAYRQAEEGNATALKMLFDRVWPVGRSRSLAAALPEVATVSDLLAASTAVANAVLAGEATVQEGLAIAQLLKAHRKVVTRHDRVQVLAQVLEEKVRRGQEEEEAEE